MYHKDNKRQTKDNVRPAQFVMPEIWKKMRYAPAKSANNMSADSVIVLVLQACQRARALRVGTLCSQPLANKDSFLGHNGKDATGVEHPL